MPTWLHRLLWAAMAGGFSQALISIVTMANDGLSAGELLLVSVVFVTGALGSIIPLLKETRPGAVPALLWSILGGVVPTVAGSLTVMIADGTITRGEWRLVGSQAIVGLFAGMTLYFKPEPRDPQSRERASD